jgi:hypothetical protein
VHNPKSIDELMANVPPVDPKANAVLERLAGK